MTPQNIANKKVILASILSQVAIYVMLTINDMIEADKVGTIFFFNMALLVTMDLLMAFPMAMMPMLHIQLPDLKPAWILHSTYKLRIRSPQKYPLCLHLIVG